MTERIPFSAISSISGTDSDGIHLLWGLPGYAPASLRGFSIQRRDARDRQERFTCHDLNPVELNILHATHRLSVPVAEIGYRQTQCPTGPRSVPDEPSADMPDGRICAEFRKDPPGLVRDRIERAGFRFDPDGSSTNRLEIAGVDAGQGLLFEEEFTFDLDAPAGLIELDIWASGDAVWIAAISDAGETVFSDTRPLPREARFSLSILAENIVQVRLSVEGGKAVILRVCRSDPGKRATVFETLAGRRLKNPVTLDDVTYSSFDRQGQALARNAIAPLGAVRGLAVAQRMAIDLPPGARGVALRILHTSRSPKLRGLDAAGRELFSSVSRIPTNTPTTLTFTQTGLARIEITAPQAETILLETCIIGAGALALPRLASPERFAFVGAPDALTAVTSVAAIRGVPQGCARYDIDLRRLVPAARISVGAAGALLITFSEGKAVHSRILTDPGGLQNAEVRLDGAGLDRVVLYLGAPANSLRICSVDFADRKAEEAEWSGVPFIVRNLQMPFRRIDPALSNLADERNRAEPRLIDPETFEPNRFEEVSGYANAVAQAAHDWPGTLATVRTRSDPQEDHVEVSAWPFLMSLSTDAGWRRMLALGHLDKDGLVEGNRYDYRITAEFRRADIDETIYSFHTVPTGLKVPGAFALDDLECSLLGRGEVVWRSDAPGGAVEPGRRGLRFRPLIPHLPTLRMTLPVPADRIALEFAPGEMQNVEIITDSDAADAAGQPRTKRQNLGASRRIDLEFDFPIDSFMLTGSAVLYAVRLPRYAKGIDPEEAVLRSSTLSGIRFEAGTPTAAPSALGTVNLQTAPVVTDTNLGSRDAPQDLGFRLHWPAPPPAGGIEALWPADLAAAPPTEALFYWIERRELGGADWKRLSDDEGPIRFFRSSGVQTDPPQVHWGADLLALFPASSAPVPPVDPLVSASDVLTAPQQPGPAPGTLFQYRVQSVDVIGRTSSPRTGSVVRLEKRRPPPMPAGPVMASPLNTEQEARGVTVRVIQAGEPGLSDGDLVLLGPSSNIVVIEWGWHDNQRSEDPWVTEFRIYWEPKPFDLVNGNITGPHAMSGGQILVPVQFDRSVPVDFMKNRRLRMGDTTYKVVSHPAGSTVTMRLNPSPTRPGARPQPGPFRFRPMLDGSELRPSRWQERVAIVPLTAETRYRHVIRDRLTFSEANPIQRIWAGVTAADNQSYIPDERISGPLSGRSGNESSVAAVSADARRYGRPAFTPPPLLPAAPVILTSEPIRGEVAHVLDLAADIAAGAITPGDLVVVERLNLVEITARLTATATGATLSAPDGSARAYTPAAPADQAELTGQLAKGPPGRVAGKFLRDILGQFETDFDTLWERTTPQPVPFGALNITLPSDAARYVFRVRRADATGRVSARGAVTDHIYRVPDLRPPSTPEIRFVASAGAMAQTRARLTDRFDIDAVAFFVLATPVGADFGPATRTPPQVLRVPNLQGQYPDAGIRLRLATGRILNPIKATRAQSVTDGPEREFSADLPVGLDAQGAVWAVALNRDGAPSRPGGPVLVLGDPAPLSVPTLVVTANGAEDLLSWSDAPAATEIAFERSTDAGATWTRVTGWRRPGAGTLSVDAGGGGARTYRIVLRSARTTADGTAVSPS
ncbi:hypothetical protein SAMN05421759_11134 [Roseivivax lentus]|uniref:Uncharacterized protein n=1 Tax=Roseivivax lentus TaxID=633194 RepID=A0A1N7NYJ7_9RHOB|nr:hypothetical protein [Roseivivax lentus]SIT03394.1 hypothetical protein SAMN05421759_11134 [Roseivivax lentus]